MGQYPAAVYLILIDPAPWTGRGTTNLSPLDAAPDRLKLVITHDEQGNRCHGSTFPAHLPHDGLPEIERPRREYKRSRSHTRMASGSEGGTRLARPALMSSLAGDAVGPCHQATGTLCLLPSDSPRTPVELFHAMPPLACAPLLGSPHKVRHFQGGQGIGAAGSGTED